MTQSPAPNLMRNLPNRINDVVKSWAENSPDRPALMEHAGIWTYAQLNSAVSDAEVWLRGSGVRPGDRVMVVCENCRAFVALLFALTGLDAWPVLVNARLSPREIESIRGHCGARRTIYTTSVSPHATDHAKRDRAVITEIPGLGVVGIGPLCPEAEPEPREENVANRVAALIYTSGTTGDPKGVMLSHRNLLFIAAGSARIRALTPHDRVYGL